MTLKQAVKACDDLGADCFEPGLKALGSDRAKVKVSAPRSLRGSVNFDACLRTKYPNDPRWDYGIDVAGKAVYVEVHPANSGNVLEVVEKLQSFKPRFGNSFSGAIAFPANPRSWRRGW